MDELSSKLAEYAEQFKSIVVEHAPEAYEALLRIVQVDAAQKLLVGFILLVVGGYVLTWPKTLWVEWTEDTARQKMKHDYRLSAWVLAVLGGAFLIEASFLLLNIWNWVAFIDPDLALANKILESSGLKP